MPRFEQDRREELVVVCSSPQRGLRVDGIGFPEPEQYGADAERPLGVVRRGSWGGRACFEVGLQQEAARSDDAGPVVLGGVEGVEGECDLFGAFVVGLGQQTPVIQYVLRPVDCENKKKALIQAIQESSLTEEQKKVMTETYGAEGLMIDPTAADFMINELRTSYAKLGKGPVGSAEILLSEKNPKKKKDAQKT